MNSLKANKMSHKQGLAVTRKFQQIVILSGTARTRIVTR